jgi:integrase
MASITRHKDRWRAHVFKNGTRRTKVFDTKREAQAWAMALEVDLGTVKGGSRTFGQAATEYLATISTQKGNPKWEGQRFEAFKAHFKADTKLADITSVDIANWRNTRLLTVVGATVQRESNLLSNLFTVAKDEWKCISVHPFKGVKMPGQADSRHQVWRWQQIKRVLRSNRSGKTGEVVRAFHIALHTALRLKEVLEGRYDSARNVMILGGEPDRTTKGDGTKRVEVPIPRRARKLLPETFTVGANEASTLFSKLSSQLLIDDLTFHDTRATALTLLARRMDVLTLARISRHKDISLLHKVYYRETAESIADRI